MEGRMKKIDEMVISQLHSEKIQLEMDLERVINSDKEASIKLSEIRNLLKRIGDNNQQLLVWRAYIPDESNEEKQ